MLPDLNNAKIYLTDLADMRVLITGATGMIGKYLAHRLCKDPNYDEVVCTTYHSSVSAIDSKLFFRNSKIKLVDYQTEISNQSSIFDEICTLQLMVSLVVLENPGGRLANSHDIGRLNEKLSDIGHFYYASSSEYGSIDKVRI